MTKKKTENMTPEEEKADFQKLRIEQAKKLAARLTQDIMKLTTENQVSQDVIFIVKTMDFAKIGNSTQWNTGATYGLDTVEILGALGYAKLAVELRLVSEMRSTANVSNDKVVK